MSERIDLELRTIKLGRIGLVAIYLTYASVVARTLANEDLGVLLLRYLGLETIYLILFSAALLARRIPYWLKHLYLVLQSALTILILSLQPEFDFVVLLFFLLGLQASLFFSGRTRWAWVIGQILLTGGSLIFYLGFMRGLALALTTMAAEIVIPAYMILIQEIESARAKSQSLLEELEQTHRQLELYAGQVAELAAMQERNRLARELHDSVSQLIFGVSLTVRSAQLLLERDPPHVQEQLIRLQGICADALSRLRSLITQLRPPLNS